MNHGKRYSHSNALKNIMCTRKHPPFPDVEFCMGKHTASYNIQSENMVYPSKGCFPLQPYRSETERNPLCPYH